MAIGTEGRGARAALAVILAALALVALPARASGTTWTVTSASDSAVGDLGSHTGSLRFALAHAASGDTVVFGLQGIDTIYASSTLTVPAGVAVGRSRAQDCGSYDAPLMTIADPSIVVAGSLDPLISLGAGATLRGVGLLGGLNTVRVTGSGAEICGVGVGRSVDGDGNPLLQPAWHAAVVVDGDHAVVRRSFLAGPVTVTPSGDDTRIGDALGGSGDSNAGVRLASVTVQADGASAAQRVTVRDPFPRGLQGLVGAGVSGGDDVATHANGWAMTPSVASALSSDGFATVQVVGSASPGSVVDIYFDDQVSVVRAGTARADGAGAFQFDGPLPGSGVTVVAGSTLDDPAHPGRVGSSSQWSQPVQVTAGATGPTATATTTPTATATATATSTPTPTRTPTGAPGDEWHDYLPIVVR